MNLYIVQASIRFHSWDFARKTLWPFLARSKLNTFPVFTYSFFPYEQSQSHNPKLWADNWTFSFCLKGGNLFVGILSCFLRNDQKIVAFFLALKDREKMENSFLDAMKSVPGIKEEVSMFNMCVVKEKPSTLH